MMDGAKLRQVTLEVVAERTKMNNANALHTKSALADIMTRLFPPPRQADLDQQQAILTFWHDLLVGGFMAFGLDVNNCDTDKCHLTERGRTALKHLSRDPLNPDGYLEHLCQRAKLSPIATSYIEEALKTYGSHCWKATAVMVGAASERLALDVRDAIVAKMISLSVQPPTALTTWPIKTVLTAINNELAPRTNTMPKKLAEAFAVNWPTMTHQIRVARNDAGHPTDTDPVSPDAVQGSMLMFPDVAATATDLIAWVAAHYA